jgi:hypothetical protein
LLALLSQNGQRLEQGFAQGALEAAERWVQEKKTGRRPRPVKQMRWVDGLRKVDPNIPNIFKRPSGRLLAKVYQNGRPLQQGFPPGALEAAKRWVQEKKAGRQPRPTVTESRWQRQAKLAPHIWRLPRGRVWAQVYQNGRRFQQSFDPGALEAAERWVQEKKDARRPRLAKGIDTASGKVDPNISQSQAAAAVRINQNGRRINESFLPGTPRKVVDRFVQKIADVGPDP